MYSGCTCFKSMYVYVSFGCLFNSVEGSQNRSGKCHSGTTMFEWLLRSDGARGSVGQELLLSVSLCPLHRGSVFPSWISAVKDPLTTWLLSSHYANPCSWPFCSPVGWHQAAFQPAVVIRWRPLRQEVQSAGTGWHQKCSSRPCGTKVERVKYLGQSLPCEIMAIKQQCSCHCCILYTEIILFYSVLSTLDLAPLWCLV